MASWEPNFRMSQMDQGPSMTQLFNQGLGGALDRRVQQLTHDEDRAYQRGREKVQDDRAAQLWAEQQKEKENLKYAGELKSNPEAIRDMVLAQNPNFGKAMDAATKAGRDTGTMGVKGVMDWYAPQIPQGTPVDITQHTPNVTNGTGGLLTQNVARQVVSDVPTKRSFTTAELPALPKLLPTNPPVRVPRKSDDVSGLFSTYDGPTPSVINSVGNAVAKGPLGQISSTLNDFFTNTSVGNTESAIQAPSRTEAYLNPKAPLVDKKIMGAQQDVAVKQAKVDNTVNKILTPQTPKQQETSKKQVTTIMDKVVVAGQSTGSTPLKVSQVEAGVIDKLFSTIDPNAQTREDARASVEGLYYSLGLSPKQVEEYSKGAVESIYGDKNDPIKLAVANAKFGGYEKNTEATNKLSLESMKEVGENRRHSETIAQKDRSDKSAQVSASKVETAAQELANRLNITNEFNKTHVTPEQSLSRATTQRILDDKTAADESHWFLPSKTGTEVKEARRKDFERRAKGDVAEFKRKNPKQPIPYELLNPILPY